MRRIEVPEATLSVLHLAQALELLIRHETCGAVLGLTDSLDTMTEPLRQHCLPTATPALGSVISDYRLSWEKTPGMSNHVAKHGEANLAVSKYSYGR